MDRKLGGKFNEKNDARDTNIELLKILAMLGIVIGHCRPASTSYWDNIYFELGQSTSDVGLFLLNTLGYLGAYGNAIFIICSAWFLTESNHIKINKINTMLADSWIFSVLFLLIASILGFNPSAKEIIRSVFPTIYGVTWFVGCYILFYILHPFLFVVLNHIDKSSLVRLNLFLFLTFFVAYFLFPHASFYYNYLFGFICIYLFVGYAKKYMRHFINDMRIQACMALVAFVMMLAVLICTNSVGMSIPMLSNEFSYFSYFNNPLVFCGSFALFNIFRMAWGGHNRFINWLSSLTLLVFVIHENLMVRTYFKPIYFQYILSHYGVAKILPASVLLGLALFVVSYAISIFYTISVRRIYLKITESILWTMEKQCMKWCELLERVN